MEQSYKNKIETIFNLETAKSHQSCHILFCILHIKKPKEYFNLFSLGIFGTKNIDDESINRLNDFNVSGDNYSIFFYRQNMKVKTLQEFLLTYDGEGFINPINKEKLKFLNSSFKDLSLLDTENICTNFAGLVPNLNFNYLLFEYFVLDKEIFKRVNKEMIKLVKFYNILKEEFNIDLEYFNDRLGNFLILIPEIRIRAKFWGSYSDAKKIFIHNFFSKEVNEKNLTINLRTEMNSEILDSRIIYPVREKIVLDKFNKEGRITLEVWNKEEKKLIYRTSGVLIKSIQLNTGLMVGRRNVRIYDKKSGKFIKEKTVHLISKEYHSSKYEKKDISTIILSRDIENRKKKLMVSKKLIQYSQNEYDKAVEDILNIINKNSEYALYLWDPYFSEKELERFIPFIENVSLIIKVISDFTSDHLKKSYNDVSDFKNKVQKSIDKLKKSQVRNIEFRYRIENLGYPFHDRFIITENKCWLLGSSFNSIGQTHSIIVEIDYPEIIKDEFERLWEELEPSKIV